MIAYPARSRRPVLPDGAHKRPDWTRTGFASPADASPTNRVVIAGSPWRRSTNQKSGTSLARRSGHRIRAGRLPLEDAQVEVCCAQSADIAQGVDAAGNKDEARATGASCSASPAAETPDLMPAPLHYAHRILHALSGNAPLRSRKAFQRGRQEQVTIPVRKRQAGRRDPSSSPQHVEKTAGSRDNPKIIEPHYSRPCRKGGST